MRKVIKFVNPVKLKESISTLNKFLKKKNNLHGPDEYTQKIKQLLNRKYGFKNIFLTNSCTSALEICSIVINFKNGDEVIMPSYTFITTGASFARTKAKIVYCDIEDKNLMPSFNDILKKITKRTKAIVIIHYQGFCVDYLEKLKKLCNRKGIILIEDAAQALGSKYKNKYLGKFGDFACFSFHHTKNIHSGIGGCLVVNNPTFYKKSIFAYDKGSDRSLQQKKIVKWYSWVSLGSSFLMSELHAAYLYPQLKSYNSIIFKRKNIYEEYLKELDFKNENFYLVKNFTCNEFNYHGLVLVLKNLNYEKFIDYLKKFNIYAFIGYIPLHVSPYGKKYLKRNQKIKVTNKIFDRIVRLPIHTDLNIKDIRYVSNKVKEFFKTF